MILLRKRVRCETSDKALKASSKLCCDVTNDPIPMSQNYF